MTSNIDCGPVIAPGIVIGKKGEDVEKLEKKILSFEHILFFKTLKMFEKEDIELVENKIFYKNNIFTKFKVKFLIYFQNLKGNFFLVFLKNLYL